MASMSLPSDEIFDQSASRCASLADSATGSKAFGGRAHPEAQIASVKREIIAKRRMGIQVMSMTEITIYHNPACGTSRNVLGLIRAAGFEPRVIEYLKTPPDRATLESLLEQMKMRPRELLREKGTPYAELGLGDDRWSDAELIDQMLANPILINRPIVVTSRGVKLCRPSETVKDIWP